MFDIFVWIKRKTQNYSSIKWLKSSLSLSKSYLIIIIFVEIPLLMCKSIYYLCAVYCTFLYFRGKKSNYFHDGFMWLWNDKSSPTFTKMKRKMVSNIYHNPQPILFSVSKLKNCIFYLSKNSRVFHRVGILWIMQITLPNNFALTIFRSLKKNIN